jgi:hypothetical protein
MSLAEQNEVQRIYMRLFCEVTWDSPLSYIYEQANKAYAEISQLNDRNGYGTKAGNLDNQLVYYLAEWMKTHVINQFIAPKPIPEIATDLTKKLREENNS